MNIENKKNVTVQSSLEDDGGESAKIDAKHRRA